MKTFFIVFSVSLIAPVIGRSAEAEPWVQLQEECARHNQSEEWLRYCAGLAVTLAQFSNPNAYTPQDPATCERSGYPCPSLDPYLRRPPSPPPGYGQPVVPPPQIDPPQDPNSSDRRSHPFLHMLPPMRRLDR